MIEFRDETPNDKKAVFHLVSSAFEGLAEAQLVEQLREDGDIVLSMVAEEESLLVGHVLLSKMAAPFPSLALAPVSVIPTWQRRGIGTALIQRAVRRARNEDWAAIFVLGAPNYYERFGFSREAAAGFTSPYAANYGRRSLAPTVSYTMPLHSALSNRLLPFTVLG